MAAKRFKPRRKLQTSDFRHMARQENSGPILFTTDGHTNLAEMERKIPDKAERSAFIAALIAGLGVDL